jgi:L-threonylcarbamoyladenylate synthase
MRLYNKEETIHSKGLLLTEMKEGAIFIYPTDTIYGIGCNARDDLAVKKIREIKNRSLHPFSVIVPGKEWVNKNCVYNKEVDKLPGPYTIILTLKNSDAVSRNVNNGNNTLGIRIPNHWFSLMVKELGIPIVTTSVNKHGRHPMTSLINLDRDIRTHINFIVYEGEKTGNASTIIDATKEKPEVIQR